MAVLVGGVDGVCYMSLGVGIVVPWDLAEVEELQEDALEEPTARSVRALASGPNSQKPGVRESRSMVAFDHRGQGR